MHPKSTITRHLLRFVMLPLVSAVWLGVAPAAYADEPVQGGGTFTISFTPVPERTADGNTFIDYTFTEITLGIFDGTRVGSGELVIHADGSLNTINSGTFTGTIAGRSGTAEMSFRGSGTFASAGGTYTVTGGTGGLAGVHAEGKDSGSATGPTTFAGTYSFKVSFSAP
jgi:hypothetical protein